MHEQELQEERGVVNLHLVLTIFLGFGMVIFGVLAVIAYRDNTTTQNHLDQLVAAAKTEAAQTQKAADDVANSKANELPFQTYVADAVDGSFQLQVPKDWSLVATHDTTGKIQLDLASDPGKVDVNTGTSAVNTHSFELQLMRQSQTEIAKTYDALLKKKLLTSKSTTVSGLPGVWLEGQIDTQRHNGIVIILPVRDKTMVISTDTRDHLDEFNAILASAKIVP